ncbi:MAG: hypothetical protein UGF89_09135, partial [Acutalibacteraceae bacterium]|nr:hypothetical protein [Acutalibacteraceae bacterium]
DYGTENVRRIDFLQFAPLNQFSVSGIEKGIFTCYEVKSCKADFHSGFGQNFVGEKNYLVMPMQTYKEVINEIPQYIGVLCPIPVGRDKFDEFTSPTELTDEVSMWRLETVRSPVPQNRERSLTELLFCMLRSGNK